LQQNKITNPLVSICIPVFNSDSFIASSLKSLKRQGYLNWNSIIVDDASTDESVKKILENIKDDRRFTLYTNSINLGMVKNWNKAISLANGEFISILHGDDFLHPDYIAKTIDCFQKHPDVGMVFSASYDIDNRRNINIYKPFDKDCFFTTDSFIKQISEKGNFVRFPSVMLKKNVYDKVDLFDERLVLAVDLEMWLRISLFFNIWYLNEPLSYYRIHSSNVSREFITVKSEIPELELAIDIFRGRIFNVLEESHAVRLENQLGNMIHNLVKSRARLRFILQTGGKSGICNFLHDYLMYSSKHGRKGSALMYFILRLAYWYFHVIPFSDILALGITDFLRLFRFNKPI
jgi:glycosyltransferase involved in cell wall biosynthesis